MTELDRIREALAYISPDDRDTWVRVGMAVKATLGDGGFDVWNSWSKDGASYHANDAKAVWKSINKSGGVTARTLYALAREHGWKPPSRANETQAGAELRWSDTAQHIWNKSQPLTGRDVASRYLGYRGCRLPESGDLRWLPAVERHPYPSMAARITDAVTREPLTLHFTRLAHDGHGKAPVEPAKLLLRGHRKAGGVVRLWSDDAVTHGLALAEGIETALAVARAFTPVWCCVDGGNLAAFPVLPGIEALSIAVDNDHSGAGRRYALACAKRWHAAGREVTLYEPPVHGDWADVAKGVQRVA